MFLCGARVSNLVPYAQSTITLISWRAGVGGGVGGMGGGRGRVSMNCKIGSENGCVRD